MSDFLMDAAVGVGGLRGELYAEVIGNFQLNPRYIVYDFGCEEEPCDPENGSINVGAQISGFVNSGVMLSAEPRARLGIGNNRVEGFASIGYSYLYDENNYDHQGFVSGVGLTLNPLFFLFGWPIWVTVGYDMHLYGTENTEMMHMVWGGISLVLDYFWDPGRYAYD